MVRPKFDYNNYGRCIECERKFLRELKIRICPDCKVFLRFRPRNKTVSRQLELKRY